MIAIKGNKIGKKLIDSTMPDWEKDWKGRSRGGKTKQKKKKNKRPSACTIKKFSSKTKEILMESDITLSHRPTKNLRGERNCKRSMKENK